MPINNDLLPITLPMKLKFGEEPQTNFINNLDALKIELIDAPSRYQAQKIAWSYTKATWSDHESDVSCENVSNKDLSKNLEDVLCFKALPTPMECLGFTFKISGISTQTVTHLIRHRAGSFGAQCTGDRDLRLDDCVVPESIENSPEFYQRYQDIVNASKQLYADMTDSKQISMMDARVILPKCMTSFYIMRLNLKDLLGFIKQRQDVQIQPEVDNIIAGKIANIVASLIPEVTSAIDFNSRDMHYIRTFRVEEGNTWTSKGTNLYRPEPKNDVFDYNENDSIYKCRREELNGTEGKPFDKKYVKMWNQITEAFQLIKNQYNMEMNNNEW